MSPWTQSGLSQKCLTERLLSSGRHGDLEEANEGLLLAVSALPHQHEHCSEGAGVDPSGSNISFKMKMLAAKLSVLVAGLHHTV